MKWCSIYKSIEDVAFNSMIIRSADNPIKCAFGWIKARWTLEKLETSKDFNYNVDMLCAA